MSPADGPQEIRPADAEALPRGDRRQPPARLAGAAEAKPACRLLVLTAFIAQGRRHLGDDPADPIRLPSAVEGQATRIGHRLCLPNQHTLWHPASGCP